VLFRFGGESGHDVFGLMILCLQVMIRDEEWCYLPSLVFCCC